MATGAQIFDMLNAGAAAGRARREEGYTNQRRAVEDPLKDQQLNRVNNARNAIVDTLGVEYGDPSTYSTAQQTDENIQKLPGELELQGQQVTQGKESIANTFNERELAGMTSMLYGVKRAVQNGATVEEALSSIPQAGKAALRFTPEDEAQLIAGIGGDPSRIDGLIDTFGKPEVVKQLLTVDKDGEAAYKTIGDRGTITDINEAPYTKPEDPLDAEYRRAQINALNRKGVGKDGDEPEKAAAKTQGMFDRAYGALADAATGGAYASSDDPDALRRTVRGLGASDIGRIVGGLTGAKQEELRDNVDAAVSGLRLLFIENPNITSRMFDTPAEQKALMKQLEGGSSIESKYEALKWTERRFKERGIEGGSPVATPTGGTPTGGTPEVIGGGTLTPGDNGVMTWTPN